MRGVREGALLAWQSLKGGSPLGGHISPPGDFQQEIPQLGHRSGSLGRMYLRIHGWWLNKGHSFSSCSLARLGSLPRSAPWESRVLPPVDITPSEQVPSPRDLLDADFWEFIVKVVHLGGIFFVHCGTPCNTFSAARKVDGGPPPLRSEHEPMGLTRLSPDNEAIVLLGNMFLLRTAEICLAAYWMGGDFSIENPLKSLIWVTPVCQELKHR